MARGKKTGGKNFEPGNNANPNGRPPLPSDLKAARNLNKIEVSRIINKFMNMSSAEMTEELSKPDSKALETMIGKIISEAVKLGDYTRVDFLLNRMIGKVTDKVEHKLPKPTVIKLIGEDAALVLGNATDEDQEDNEI